MQTDMVKTVRTKKLSKGWKWVIRGLPLAGAVAASLLTLSRVGHQFLVLIVLVWLQVFLLFECFLAGK